MINPFKKRRISIQVRAAASAKLHAAAEQAAPRETGGMLLGWWDKGSVVIEDVAVVEDENATTHSWVRNEGKAQLTLDQIKGEYASAPIGYVGDWHCHPADVGVSSTDIQSLKVASAQYELPVVLIVRKPRNQLDFHVAQGGEILQAEVTS